MEMENTPESSPNTFKKLQLWTEKDTKRLMDLHKEYLPQIGPLKRFKNKKDMWSNIANEYPGKSAKQCEERYKTVLKRKRPKVEPCYVAMSPDTKSFKIVTASESEDANEKCNLPIDSSATGQQITSEFIIKTELPDDVVEQEEENYSNEDDERLMEEMHSSDETSSNWFKTVNGYPLEQELYKNLPLTDFVQRLLAKRCVTFMNADDQYLLMTGRRGIAKDEYLKVGTSEEKEPLVLRDVISYDEIKLSAFLSVTSRTELLNDGNRYNNGVIEKDVDKIEKEGVVVGVMGARFEKPLVMEYQDIVIDSKQNIKELGYGYRKENNLSLDNNLQRLVDYRRLWQAFYDTEDVLYEQLKIDNERFYKLNNNLVFDTVMMKKRYAITFDTLLMESQKKAEQANKQAYVHVVGIGLGVWKIAEQQTKIFLECFSQRLNNLLPKLNNIAAIHFSWFHLDEWHDLKNNGFIHSPSHPNGGIHTFLSNRNPADKLRGEFENMLLIISYAWDGNALPGNEFWIGSLSGSNDPSTACSTLITELHNPHINTEYVNGNNLHIASNEYGVLHIADFVKKVLD